MNRPLEQSTPTADPRSGFTILEIMIATAILTLGLVGILALFPVAIFTGKRIVEQSTAVVIAESVAEAIREGVRNNLRYNRYGQPYFVFKHDGVTDPIPLQQERERYSHDYYILLPGYRRAQFSGRTARDKAMDSAKTFLFPETDSAKNGNGRQERADNDADDYTYRFENGESYKDIWVEKTYSLGNYLPGLEAEGIRVLRDQKIDAIRQYSYAFAISPSYNDANITLSPNSDAYRPAGRLFHVRIMIFRSFVPVEKGAESPVPVYELDFEVAI